MKKTVVSVALVLVLALTALALGACTSSSSSGSVSSASGSAASASASAASASAAASSAAASSASAASASASSASASSAAAAKIELADGEYTAKFKTDSTMFHVNEFYKDQVALTVKDGKATAHVVLAGTGYVKLCPGTVEDAQKDGAALLEFIPEKVDFGDGTDPDEVYAFDIPVPVLDEPFDLATLGTKGKWYDHKVTVSDVQPKQ